MTPASPVRTQRPAWPAMSLAQSHAMLTAPGAMFEMETVVQYGRTVRAWKNGPKSLVELFYAAAAHGEREFIVHETERVTFDVFARAAQAFARVLTQAGVTRGDRVVIVMRNLPEWPVCFFGAALAGAVATPLNAWWSAAELAHGIADSGAVVAVLDAERYARVRERLADLPQLRQVLVCRAGDAELGQEARTLEAAIGGPADWAHAPPVAPPGQMPAPDDDATLFYTSGTSGGPKGALASHRATVTPIFATLLGQARAYLRRGEALPEPDPAAPQRCYVVAIPFFHVTGCFALLDVALAMGFKLVLMRRFEPEAAMALIERERATGITGVPTIPWQLLEHPERSRYDLSSLELVTYGGAPAAPALVERMAQAWPNTLTGTGWGMTETCATFTGHLGEDYANRPDSCGPATPVGDMKVVDTHGRTLEPGAVGELWVYGPHVVKGYWNKPATTAAAFEDGWLKTGDLARIDDEGFCYIVDRIKDVIIRGGENIYSVEVEDVLYTHPAVMDAAIVPIVHASLGEEPGAVVTLKPGADATEAELRAWVSARLASFKTPVRVLLRREPLPRNANGKILKSELKSLFVVADAPARSAEFS